MTEEGRSGTVFRGEPGLTSGESVTRSRLERGPKRPKASNFETGSENKEIDANVRGQAEDGLNGDLDFLYFVGDHYKLR